MPVSVRRHNLQRLRQELNVTQETLAGWIGRSTATIKAVEIGKLALSENLATLIASVTGADKEWLLRNNLSEPISPLIRMSAKMSPQEQAYGYTFALLQHLFDRLFAALARMQPSPIRKSLEIFIKATMAALEEKGQIPDCEYGLDVSVDTFEFFKAHPENLDPDLAGVINIDYLIKDAYLLEQKGKDYGRKVMKEGREAEHRDQPPRAVTAHPEPLEVAQAQAAFEAARNLNPHELAEALALTQDEKPYLANQKGSPRKRPRQSPASPAPSDRRSSRRSSANRRGEAR
jgi:DNA-binding XRE family transcriptional regulator